VFGPDGGAHVFGLVSRRNQAFKKSNVAILFDKLVLCARRRRLIGTRLQIAGDSTGFEVGHTSHYFRSRRGDKRFSVPRWPKLTGCVDIDSHFILSAHVGIGPSRDTLQAPEVLLDASRRVNIRRVLWDGGCDSEKMHVFIRTQLHAHSLIPIKSGRKVRRWPKTKYRRQMKKRFFKRLFGQRWQIESVFSRHKRRLSSELRAKTWSAQQAEVYLRALLHNLMLLRLSPLQVFNRALNS
jgi:transposase